MSLIEVASLTVQRELHEYRDHHYSSGVREVVWMDDTSSPEGVVSPL